MWGRWNCRRAGTLTPIGHCAREGSLWLSTRRTNRSRTLVVLAAVSGLTMSTALAQAPAPPSPAPASPPAAASSKPGSSQIVNTQSKDEWLASKLKGTTVLGSDDQKIGSVTDI